MSLLAPCANIAWWLANVPAHAAFITALNHPRKAQDRILRSYVAQNAETQFGRDHGFDRIGSVEEFRRRVPLRDYDEIAPYIDRIAGGEKNVLTSRPVTRFATSSGSTRAVKWIPYTADLQAEFNRAIGPWIVDMFSSDPPLAMGCAYWSISPVARRAEHRPSAIPVGFEEDSAYLGGVRKRLVDAVMAVPGEVRHCADIDAFRYLTLRFLLARRDLRLISIWHPSFFQLLLSGVAGHWEELLQHIEHGTVANLVMLEDSVRHRLIAGILPDPRRAAELRSIGEGNWQAIWPSLRLISAWGSVHAAGAATALSDAFPGTRFQAKGLLATEAFVTIPFRNQWPLAIRSHHFELIDDAGRSWSVDEVRRDAEYSVAVTTAGGLYRYRLGDRVRVVGHLGRTPSLQFVGRNDQVADRFGEKLSEGFVTAVLSRLFVDFAPQPTFAMLVPDGEAGETACRYVLLLESSQAPPSALSEQLDRALCENPHYAYCRDLKQLGLACVFMLKSNAYPVYAASLVASGSRLGDVKPASLSRQEGWIKKFEGSYLRE